jgi:nicotinamidase-related amidase
MLLNRSNSLLLLVDVQEKLTPKILDNESMCNRCAWLLQLAKAMHVPILVSEQYPQGLGYTVESLRHHTPKEAPVEKVHFSCMQVPEYVKKLEAYQKNQLVLIGIEAHVCILQTALEMKDKGYEVFVVVDAVSSRHAIDLQYALKRMKHAGIQLITSEMVFFEWVRQAGTEEFKALSKTFLVSAQRE